MSVRKCDHDGAIRLMFSHPLLGPQVILFTDLTSETDLPLDLCKAVWLGVAEGLRLPDWMTQVKVLSLGPEMVK